MSLRQTTLLILVLQSCLSLAAQTRSTAYGVTVREGGLRSAVSRTPSKRYVLSHKAADSHPDINALRDVLQYDFYVPEDAQISVKVSPVALQDFVQVVPVGMYGGYPVKRLVVDLLHDVALTGATPLDSFAVTITWDQPLIAAVPLRPPSTSVFLNPSWLPRLASTSKRDDRPQVQVDPKSWYDRLASYKKVHTSRDGIAVIRGTDILAGGSATPFDGLALYWRGIEQPVHIDDVDSSGTLTQSDLIFFRGRRPEGDSTYYDVQDSVAVFYVTTAKLGQHSRLTDFTFANSADDTVKSVFVRQHLELDTGYFHPGSGVDEDQSIFESSLVYLEGFYWRNLYGRSKQHTTLTTRFTPAPTGQVSFSVKYATTTANVKYAPEHIVSIWPPASQTPVLKETEGYQLVQQTWSGASASVPSGLQFITVQATGSDELRSQPDWYSEVLIDAIDVSGDASPVLDSGRLNCSVTAVERSLLRVDNVRSGKIYVLDTAKLAFSKVRNHAPGFTVRAGIWPAIVPDVAWDGLSFSASVSIGSRTILFDSLKATHALVVLDTLTGQLTEYRDLTPTQLLSRLKEVPRNILAVIVNAGARPDRDLVEELGKRGIVAVNTEIQHVWIAAASNGNGAFSKNQGLTAHFTDLRGSDGSSTMLLSKGLHHIYVCDETGLEQARIHLAKNQGVSFDSTFGDIIAIAHRTHMQEASRWASHRYAHSGKKVSLYDVEAIFEEYDAGRHSPEAIRAFLKDAFYKASKKPTHCVLIGNASWDVRQAIKQGNVSARRIDQVPTYGRPSSDMWFGLLDNERDVAMPELIVSRFPVTTAEECKSLVDKVIVADTQTYNPNLRKFLFVGGGTEEENFCQMYQRMLDDTFGSEIVFTEPPLCIDTVTVCNTDYDAPGLQIRQKINNGVAWMNYIGHGGTDVFDIKDWDPQDLNNTNKYPVLATFSCLTGNFSSPSSLCENAAYLVEPQKGVVAAMGATGYQYLPVVDLLHFRFHEAMRSKGLRAIGDLTYEAKRAFSTMNNQFGRNAAMQYCILGDPFTRLRIDTTSDLQVYATNITVRDKEGQSEIFVQQDSMYVTVDVWNAGIATSLPSEVIVRRYIPGSNVAGDSVLISIPEGFCSTRTLSAAFDTRMLGEHRIEVQIDPRRYLPDNTSNNVASVAVLVQNRSLQIIDPQPYGTVDVQSPRFRLLYPYVRYDRSDEPVTVSIHTSYDDARNGSTSLFSEVSRADSGTYVDVLFRPTALEVSSIDTGSVYWLRAFSSRSDAVLQPFVFRRGIVDPEEHVMYAKGLPNRNDSIRYDEATRALRLIDRTIPISVLSRSVLSSDPVRQPSLRIAYGDTVLQSSFRNGLNIVVIRPFATTPRVVRRYDTSPTPSPMETGHSGGAVEFLTFLKDSVLDHEYVAIAACNESFTQFERLGLLSELRSSLRSFGSSLSDSIVIGAAYAFVGSRVKRDFAYEDVRGPLISASAVIDTVLSIRYERARVADIEVLRPRALKMISTKTEGLPANTVTMYGYDGQPLTQQLAGTWEAPRNSSTIQQATVSLSLVATDSQPDPSFTSLSIHYEPAPMFYVDSSMISIAVPEALRGDSVDVSIKLKNLQFRFTSPDAAVATVARASDDTLRQQVTNTTIPSIDADGAGIVTMRAYNDPDWSDVVVRATIEQPGEEKSLVRLFQTAQTRYRPSEDSSAPSIAVYAHQRPLVTGDYVDSMPTFMIQLRDRSRLPIRSDDNFIVFLNGVRIRSTNVKDFTFMDSRACENVYPDTDIRAELSFSYPAEIGENLLIVRVTDASGNKDTSEIYFWHQREEQIRDVTVAPNPTSGPASFTVSMAGNARVYPAYLSLHDVQGRIVSERSVVLYTGKTSVSWDGASMQGSDLAPGVYFWSITVPSSPQVPVENRTSGIITILR